MRFFAIFTVTYQVDFESRFDVDPRHSGDLAALETGGALMDTPKSIPVFEIESVERAFWLDHDSTEYVDWSKAERASFPNLKP